MLAQETGIYTDVPEILPHLQAMENGLEMAVQPIASRERAVALKRAEACPLPTTRLGRCLTANKDRSYASPSNPDIVRIPHPFRLSHQNAKVEMRSAKNLAKSAF